MLADFAKLDARTKRIVVHDGVGHSFWLAPNHEPEKLAAAKIDWVFMVWQPANWEHLHKMPADLNPTEAGDTSPPSQIDVYTAGIDWAGVTVPKGIEVVDQRLVAHGFTPADGVVIEGKVTDLSTGQPGRHNAAAAGRAADEGRILTRPSPRPGDAQGRWVPKNSPAGWVRVVVEADGFVPHRRPCPVRRAAPLAVLR
ncbi:MAG: hypothetical protein WKF75_00330 [Singulisphaera sp.]